MATWQVGDVRITRVVDLDFALPSERPVPEWCVPAFAPSREEVGIAFSAFVLTGAGPPIVVDPWLANDGPRQAHGATSTVERLLSGARAAGAAVEDVRLVVNTHLDGIGWNTRPSSQVGWHPTFPSARYVWPAANLAVHRDDDRLAPLRAADVIDEVETPIELAPGVTLVDAPGHETGHGVVWVRSAGRSACLSGHLFTSPLQVADPSIAADEDPVAAEATRRAVLRELAESGGLLLGSLLGGPGGGRVRGDSAGWALVPEAT